MFVELFLKNFLIFIVTFRKSVITTVKGIGLLSRKYDFALSFDGRYDECSAECLKEVFEDSPIVKLMEAIVSVFEGTEAEEWGFSYARYFNQIGIEPEWEQMPLVKLGEKLMDGKRMRDFHRIVLDMDYRRELLGEV